MVSLRCEQVTATKACVEVNFRPCMRERYTLSFITVFSGTVNYLKNRSVWWQDTCDSAVKLVRLWLCRSAAVLVTNAAISSKNDLPLFFTALYRNSKLALNFYAPTPLRMREPRGRGLISQRVGILGAVQVGHSRPST